MPRANQYFLPNRIRHITTAAGGEVTEGLKGYQLREEATRYKALFEVKNGDIALENTRLWDTNL
jgi:hypothetical protein